MSRTGPVTKAAGSVALGLAQIRVGESAANIATVTPVLSSSNSIGALNSSKFVSEKEYWELKSGFPALIDTTIALTEACRLECEFKELNPFNVALALGNDAPSDGTSETLSGEILLGATVAPDYIRMEAIYTYPNGTSTMKIIFPRAQCKSSVEIDLQAEDNANIPLTFESTTASSEISGGNAAWDLKPLGHIMFAIS